MRVRSGDDGYTACPEYHRATGRYMAGRRRAVMVPIMLLASAGRSTQALAWRVVSAKAVTCLFRRQSAAADNVPQFQPKEVYDGCFHQESHFVAN